VTDRRFLVVWNPEAGSKAGLPTNGTTEPELRHLMARHGLGDELFRSSSEEAALARVDQAVADGYDAIVGAGGDGTVRSIAFRLLDRPVALGILPLGSAMNIARSLEIPRDLDAAAGILATATARSIDVGTARDRPFLEIASIGATAEILEQAQHVDKGHFHAIFTMVRDGLRQRPVRVEIALDDRRIRARPLALAVANGPYTGLGLTLAPDAKIDDGQLTVVLFSGMSPLGLARHLLTIIGGREPRSRVRSYSGRTISITSASPLSIRIDSEDGGSTPIELSVRQGALKVLAPPS
jgi:YegS/Rv2252/BmrU family lipid kinase